MAGSKESAVRSTLKGLSDFFLQEVKTLEKEKKAKDYRVIHTPKPVKPEEKPASNLVNHTQNAVEESLIFPTQPLINLLHQEVQEYLEKNQIERAALTLLEHQSTTIRHQAINQHNKRLKKAVASNTNIKVNPDKNLPPEPEVLVPLVSSAMNLNGSTVPAPEAARCGPIDEMTASKPFRNRHKTQLDETDLKASPNVIAKACNLNNNNPPTPPKTQPSSDDDDARLDEIEKEILDFKSTRDEIGADLLRMMRDDLPAEWRLVQLTVDNSADDAAGGRFKIEPKDEPILNHNFGLLVVTAQCGGGSNRKNNQEKEQEVLNVVRVPAVPRQNCPTIMKEMNDILKFHTRMFNAEQIAERTAEEEAETDPAIAKKNRLKKYRELKEEVDTRVTSLIDTIENRWLGFAKVLLLGKPVVQENDPDSVKRQSDLESAVQEITRDFFASDPEFVSSGRKQVLHRLLDGGKVVQRTDQLATGLNYVLNKDQTRLAQLVQRVKEVVKTRLNQENVTRHPVVLVLDNNIQQLPWESLTCLQNPPQPMSRVPSASFLCALAANHTRSKNSISKTGVRQDKIYYVLNPDQNLKNTQKRLEGELTSLGSEGKIGEHPSLPDMKRVLSEMDAFMYCGHGTSVRTMPTQEVEKMRVRALPMLMGCRSGQMSRLGRSLDPIGVASSYLIASAPCILGFLWGVTDKDVDQWTVAFMQHWLGRNGSKDGLLTSNEKQKEFVRAVAEQRSKFTRNINRAAAVVYGLPFVLE